MAKDTLNIAFQQVEWNAVAAQALAGAQGSHPTYTLAELEREVRDPANASRLLAVVDFNEPGGRLLGYCVVWVEVFGTGREMVIQAGEALTNTYRVMPWVMPAFDRLALEMKCASIRAHVDAKTRPAMKRALKRVGYSEAEIVMRRELG